MAGVAATFNFDGSNLQNLFQSRLYYLSEGAPTHAFFISSGNTRNGDLFIGRHFYHGRTELTFECLGLITHHSQAFSNIIGHLIPRDGHDRRMTYCIVFKNGYVCGPSADINQCHAYFLFVRVEHGKRRTKRLQNDICNLISSLFDASIDILGCRNQSRDDVNIGFQANTAHSDRIDHSVLSVDNEFLRDDVQYFTVRRHGYVCSVLQQSLHIRLGYFTIPIRNRYDTARLKALDMIACDSDDYILHRNSCHAFGFLYGQADSRNRLIDVYDDPSVQAIRFRHTDAQNLNSVQLV
uniref:Uncharacterized protein n=1 Tax=uncultured marine microorganism HF4000_APKG2M17 TaxID=455548 RepID=B3T6T5_9ZZZZ|nr:hypothetical protein ALOHA_HF4000APKG2M17ctg1g16 [uncultured marine microorganism HF4000_APKG2M17]